MTQPTDLTNATLRTTALVEAVKVFIAEKEPGKSTEDTSLTVLTIADDFLQYIIGGYADDPINVRDRGVSAAPVAAPAPAPAAKPAAAAKPAKAKPAPAPKPVEEPEADEAPATDTSKEQVGEIISKLLSAKLREEAIGLLKDFKATSVSGVKPADYEKFVAAGKVLLGQAALAAQGEVEADIED